MDRVCDLHTHSIYSDGSHSPAWLVKKAGEIGLSALALTDHNTVAGLPELTAAAEGTGVEAVPGVEFSTDYLGIDLHIVALFVKPSAYDRIEALMAEGDRAKEESNQDLCRKLCAAGYHIDYPAVRDATPSGHVNRAHIAQALFRAGEVPSVKAAFAGILRPGEGFYTPPARPEACGMVEFIRSVGAVPVLAHPFLRLDEEQLRTFLRKACPRGLAAMETEYSTFDGPTVALAKQIAGEFGLLESGGSDFHGSSKPDIALGTGRGTLRVPYEFMLRLKAEAK